MVKTFKLVWIDESIDNNENKVFQQKLKGLSIDTIFLNQQSEAQKFIQTNEQTFDLLMVISGALLQELDPALKGGFICFCGNSKQYYQKFLDLKQGLALIDFGFQVVKQLVIQYIQFLKSKQILHFSFCPPFVQQKHYYHSNQEISFKFLLANAKIKQNVNIKNQNELEEMLDSDIRKLVNDQGLIQLKEQVKGKNLTVFEKLMYYYLDTLYIPLNHHLVNQSYEQIQNILLVLFDGFSKLKQTQALPKLLYRGIKFNEKTTWDDLLNCEKNQSRVFWNALIGVSNTKQVSEHFASQGDYEYRVIFEIELSQKSPHPYFEFNNANSKFSHEKEILLFPQFGFQVLKINLNGKYMYCQIKQIKNNFAMALDQDKREQYWNQRIQKEIKPNLEYVMKFHLIRVYSVINILSNSDEINNKSQVLKEEVILCFKKLILQLKEYSPDYLQFNSLLDSFESVIKSRMNFQFPINYTSIQPLLELINSTIQAFQDEFIKLIKRLFNLKLQENELIQIIGYSVYERLYHNNQHIYDRLSYQTIKKNIIQKNHYYNKNGQSRILLIGYGPQSHLFNLICNAKIYTGNLATENAVKKSIINNIEIIHAHTSSFLTLKGWLALQKALEIGPLNQIFIVLGDREYGFKSQMLQTFKQYINLITIIYYKYRVSDEETQDKIHDFIVVSKEDCPQKIIQKMERVFQPEIQYEVRLNQNLIIEKSIIFKSEENTTFSSFFALFYGSEIHPIISSFFSCFKQFASKLKEQENQDIESILCIFRDKAQNFISTSIVKIMNKYEKEIDELLSLFQCTDDKYLALWNILYEINNNYQQEYLYLHNGILNRLISNYNLSQNIKACPHCGLIWLKVSDCNGLSNCGEFPETEANYVEKFLHQIYTFTIGENGEVSFKKSEQQFQGKQYKQPEEKQYKEPQRRVGCGNYFDWDNLPLFDQKVIAELLFSYDQRQYEVEYSLKNWPNQQDIQSIEIAKQNFQNEIPNLIKKAIVDYL